MKKAKIVFKKLKIKGNVINHQASNKLRNNELYPLIFFFFALDFPCSSTSHQCPPFPCEKVEEKWSGWHFVSLQQQLCEDPRGKGGWQHLVVKVCFRLLSSEVMVPVCFIWSHRCPHLFSHGGVASGISYLIFYCPRQLYALQ